MEGDAGASRLNPNEIDDSSSSEVATDQTGSEVKAEDSQESDVATDQTSSEATEADLEQDAEDSSETEPGIELDTETGADDVADDGNPSRLGRSWLVGIASALVVVAGGVGAGGYLALKSHRESQDIARRDDSAVQAAKDCVAATQAPDTTAMAASAQKIIECGTGAFRSQAILYSGLLVEAYQAANAQVQVSDLRAAVERNNSDGSVDVLVPLRVKVSNSATQNQEAGYRLRVTMTLDEGKYRIAKLDQVAK
jgi:Mce-associated membrane protein